MQKRPTITVEGRITYCHRQVKLTPPFRFLDEYEQVVHFVLDDGGGGTITISDKTPLSAGDRIRITSVQATPLLIERISYDSEGNEVTKHLYSIC